LGALGFALLALTPACSQTNGSPTPQLSTPSASATGGFRTFEEADAGLLRALGEVQDRLASTAGVRWEQTPARTAVAACASGRRSATYTSGASAATMADDQWRNAVRALDAVIAPLGFTEVTVLADAPGKHVVSVQGPDGARMVFGSEARVDATILGPCLPSAGS